MYLNTNTLLCILKIHKIWPSSEVTLLRPVYTKNVSGYVCNHVSPRGNETLRPLRVAIGERRQRNPCLKHTYIKTPPVGRWQSMTSLPARPRYKGHRKNTSFTSSSEACVRSMAHSLGDAVSHSPLGKHGYIRNLRPSPSWELRTASPRGRYWGTSIPTPPCWGECKPISRKRRALSQLYQAKGVALGRLMAVSDIIPFGQKPELHTLKHLPARCRDYRTQGRAQRHGIRERFL